MTKTTETWEERFDQAFLDVMYKDDGYTEERAVLKAFIRAELALARQEEAVAYGGCTNCYGKGYSTTKMYASGRHYTQEQNPYIPCKECDRGTQFAKAQERARQEGEKAGREKDRERIIKAVEGLQVDISIDTLYDIILEKHGMNEPFIESH